MSILELKEQYSHIELFSQNIDFDFRHKIFKSLFDNLFENKVVIHDRFTCIAKIERVEILPDYFTVFVIPQTLIPTGTPSDKRKERAFEKLKRGWEASCRWEHMSFVEDCLCSSPYACWLMWIDSELVRKVDSLVSDNKFDEALNLTMNKM